MTRGKKTVKLHPPRLYDSATQTLEALDVLIGQCTSIGVTPSPRITKLRDDILQLALEEQQQYAEVEQLADNMATNQADAAALLARPEEITPEQKTNALAAVLQTQTPEHAKALRRLKNQMRFKSARLAHQRMRTDGDELITGLLAKYVEALTLEFECLVPELISGGYEAMRDAHAYAQEHGITANDARDWKSYPKTVAPHYMRVRALDLVTKLEAAVTAAEELRSRGITPAISTDVENHPPLSITTFADISKLPDFATFETRKVLWFAQAVDNGATIRLTTAEDAVSHYRPKETAMST